MSFLNFPVLTEDQLKQRLAPPQNRCRVLIDTDTANEIDDQFALTWALLSPEKLSIEAVTAEPFSFSHHQAGLLAAEQALENNSIDAELAGGFSGWVQRLHKQGRRANDVNFVGTAEGMELSYHEILRIYDKLGIASSGNVSRGADRYLPSASEPVKSESVDAIIDFAKSGDSDDPLYIAAMGCVTNIASAFLLAPEIINDVVVVWTSAFPSCSPQCNRPSLNLVQDTHASRLMFDCGVPLVYLPGYQVGAQLTISLPEMAEFVKGRREIGNYLYELYFNNPLHSMFAIDDTARRTWVIWDIIDIAWLLNPEWVPTHLTTSPVLNSDLFWEKDAARHIIREAYDIKRDEIFLDFYNKLGS